eukprot:jgi/Mesvir1/23499/Mv22341-RA.1
MANNDRAQVRCEECGKWRYMPNGYQPPRGALWTCVMSRDFYPAFASCEAPAEEPHMEEPWRRKFVEDLGWPVLRERIQAYRNGDCTRPRGDRIFPVMSLGEFRLAHATPTEAGPPRLWRKVVPYSAVRAAVATAITKFERKINDEYSATWVERASMLPTPASVITSEGPWGALVYLESRWVSVRGSLYGLLDIQRELFEGDWVLLDAQLTGPTEGPAEGPAYRAALNCPAADDGPAAIPAGGGAVGGAGGQNQGEGAGAGGGTRNGQDQGRGKDVMRGRGEGTGNGHSGDRGEGMMSGRGEDPGGEKGAGVRDDEGVDKGQDMGDNSGGRKRAFPTACDAGSQASDDESCVDASRHNKRPAPLPTRHQEDASKMPPPKPRPPHREQGGHAAAPMDQRGKQKEPMDTGQELLRGRQLLRGGAPVRLPGPSNGEGPLRGAEPSNGAGPSNREGSAQRQRAGRTVLEWEHGDGPPAVPPGPAASATNNKPATMSHKPARGVPDHGSSGCYPQQWEVVVANSESQGCLVEQASLSDPDPAPVPSAVRAPPKPRGSWQHGNMNEASPRLTSVLHCICKLRKDQVQNQDMFVCEGCKLYFHPECVGLLLQDLRDREGRNRKLFVCSEHNDPAAIAARKAERLQRQENLSLVTDNLSSESQGGSVGHPPRDDKRSYRGGQPLPPARGGHNAINRNAANATRSRKPPSWPHGCRCRYVSWYVWGDPHGAAERLRRQVVRMDYLKGVEIRPLPTDHPIFAGKQAAGAPTGRDAAAGSRAGSGASSERKQQVQHGLYATRNWGKAKKVGNYTGTMRAGHSMANSQYVFELKVPDQREAGKEVLLMIDAKNYGNELRFMNDYRNIAARANVRFGGTEFDASGQPFVAVYTVRHIRKGEELLVNYGKKYPSKFLGGESATDDNEEQQQEEDTDRDEDYSATSEDDDDEDEDFTL